MTDRAAALEVACELAADWPAMRKSQELKLCHLIADVILEAKAQEAGRYDLLESFRIRAAELRAQIKED